MTNSINSTFQLGKQTLSYQQQGSGTPLVLIHGMATDHRLWQPQLEAFAASHAVISYDLRGFGTSSRPIEPYTAEDDLAALLDHLKVDSAHILGLSLGSSIATRFALNHPQRCQSLIAAGPVLQGFDDARDFMTGLKQVWGTAKELGLDAAREQWLNLPLFAGLTPSSVYGSLGLQMINDYDGWHWLNRDPETWPEVMPAERLADISCPTLIISGENEMAGLQRAGAFMLAQIPDAKAVFIEAAGHMVNLEQPDLFNQPVVSFLNSV
ncbi:MAG: alpha/beta hydrolase [Immundisolibacteraceae bacterium]|nr:alpha/beta hydrolase [Immundisolibacteraceae bacterium]